MRDQLNEDFNSALYLEEGSVPPGPDSSSPITPHEIQIARMRHAAGIADSETPSIAPGASEATPAPGGALILTSGTFDGVPPPGHDFHRDPYHGVEAYQTRLEGVSWPTPSPAEACGAPFRAVRGCSCSVQVVPDHCDRLECSQPYCERRNRDRRGMDIYKRLEEARGRRWLLYWVFTVPPALRDRVAKPGAWQKLVARLIHRLRVYHKLQYACERSDPAGEDGVRWHPHINLVWIRTDGRGSLPEEELEQIKHAWREILYTAEYKEVRRATNQKEIDLEASLVRLVELEAAPLNVYASFIADGEENDGKRRHLASYMGRPWSRWAKTQKYLLRVKWFGKPPKIDKPSGPNMCPKCACEIVYMAVGSREEAERLKSLGYERLAEECYARRKALRRMAKVKPPKFTVRIAAGQKTTWTRES